MLELQLQLLLLHQHPVQSASHYFLASVTSQAANHLEEVSYTKCYMK